MADTVILRMDAVVAGYGELLWCSTRPASRCVATRSTTIIGRNGAGKSTAIKAIFGMVLFDPWSMRVVRRRRRGRSQPDRAATARHQLRAAGRNVFPRMTVRSNLELGGVSLGNLRLTRERVDSIAFELFPMLRVKADKQASTLSGGEQKMLEIGRAMPLEPRLLLIDEPSVGVCHPGAAGLRTIAATARPRNPPCS